MTERTYTVVDADAHINEIPTDWDGLNQAHPGWLSAGQDGGKTVAKIEGKLYPQQTGPGCGVPIDSSLAPATKKGAFDIEQRLRDMDTEGIDVQVMYGGLSIGTTSFEDHGFARDFAIAYNDWLLDDMCGADADRLKGVAVVPLQDVQASVNELKRVKDKGAPAVTIPPAVGDRNLDHPDFLEFFEACQALDLAVGVHNAPGMNTPLPAAGRFDNYVQVHVLSFPVDQLVAWTALTFGGVLDRFPDLRVAFLECGVGWVPYFIDRSAEHVEKRGDLVPAMTSQPRDYIDRGQCYFSFEAEDPFVGHYIEHFGADSIVFASDYPHWDCEFPGTVDEAEEHNQDLGDEVLAKIMGANALRLYGLEAP